MGLPVITTNTPRMPVTGQKRTGLNSAGQPKINVPAVASVTTRKPKGTT